MLCVGDSTRHWHRIEHFFASEFRQWDLLRLCERLAPIDRNGELARRCWIETVEDSIGFAVSLAGGFSSYLDTIDAKVKSNWRNRSRKIAALNPIFSRATNRCTRCNGGGGSQIRCARTHKLESRRRTWYGQGRPASSLLY